MRVALIIMLCVFLKSSFGQGKHVLQVNASDRPASFFQQKKYAYNNHPQDSVQARTEIKNLIDKLQTDGFLASSVDSLRADSLHTTAYIYVGEKFAHVILANGNADDKRITDAGLKNVLYDGQPIDIGQVQVAKNNLLHAYENSGFPFASVRLDSITEGKDVITAKIYVEKNELIRYDTLKLLGKTRTKRAFLKNYLGIKPGRPYNESTIDKITQRLKNLPSVDVLQPDKIIFRNGKAIPTLFLKDKKASQFDGLVGFLPGSSGQKLLVTGDAHISFTSPFGMGESFSLQWQKLQPQTQSLDVKFIYPYLLGLPVGINASFSLYKRDTSYVNINGDYGIQYQISGTSYLKASLKQTISIITNVDTSYILQYNTLPPNIDLSTNEFALEYFVEKLDYKFNPTSGYTFTVGGSAGVRTIKKNSTILNLNDPETGGTYAFLYDTVKLNAFEFHIGLSIDKYWRLAARHTIKTSFDGKYLGSKTVYQNEEYRLGGINSLRGFDDQSIFTPYYAMGNLEYRFILSKNSFFNAFFNAAVVQNAIAGRSPIDVPYGFGVGAAIETKAGIFGITYAMGTQEGNPITFNSAKIHFGYINYF